MERKVERHEREEDVESPRDRRVRGHRHDSSQTESCEDGRHENEAEGKSFLDFRDGRLRGRSLSDPGQQKGCSGREPENEQGEPERDGDGERERPEGYIVQGSAEEPDEYDHGQDRGSRDPSTATADHSPGD